MHLGSGKNVTYSVDEQAAKLPVVLPKGAAHRPIALVPGSRVAQ